MKYYWYSAKFRWFEQSDEGYEQGVLKDEHPFQYKNDTRKRVFSFSLVNWKEITKEEYDLFNQ